MKNAVYICHTRFPDGNAYATRVVNLCKMFNELGYNLHIIGFNDKVEQQKINNHISYETLNGLGRSKLSVFKGYIQNKSVLVRKLLKYLNENKVDLIILSGYYGTHKKPLIKLARSRGIKVVIEMCEWFQPNQVICGRLGPFFWDMEWGNKIINCNADGVIGISTLITDFYKSKGMKSITIPTVLETDNFPFTTEYNIEDEKIVIGYAGSIGKGKDHLIEVIEATNQVNKNIKNCFRLVLLGISDQLLKKYLNNESLYYETKSFIECHPRVSHELVKERLKTFNYTFLIRENNLNSNAGFPTKFGESMAAGVPIIANITGDLGLYLQNNKQGFILEECSVDSVVEVLLKIIELDAEAYKEMRRNSRVCAETSFNYRCYEGVLREFISSL